MERYEKRGESVLKMVKGGRHRAQIGKLAGVATEFNGPSAPRRRERGRKKVGGAELAR